MAFVLMFMLMFHPFIPHRHLGESEESEHHEHGASHTDTTFTMTSHGHEEKLLIGMFAPFLLLIIFDINRSLVHHMRLFFSREIRKRVRRKPPPLTLLFAGGILHSRIP